MNDEVYVELNEAAEVILEYISSEEIEEKVKTIQDNARSGFIAGLAFAFCLIGAKCKKYTSKDPLSAEQED